MKKLSIIVPCYNEQETLGIFYKEAINIISKINNYEFEFIFVNDGSKDNTLNILKELSDKDSRVRYISFSRNFGKEAAIFAGLKNCTGDLGVLMDADLQDPPSLLPKMIQCIEEGYDSVATHRVTREGEPPIRSFFARKFYKIINKISEVNIVDGARDYRLMTRDMIDAILSMSEYNRFSKGIFAWIGFNTKWIEYVNVERVAGETKWSFWKLFKYALDGIVAFTTMPLRITSILGILTSVAAAIYTLYIIISTLITGIDVPGYASSISIIMFLGGIQLIALGIIGEYLARTYMEVKNRPVYIAKEDNINE